VEYSGQALPVHSHWMALNLRQLPIFQGDKSCVFQQDSTQPHNFKSINFLLESTVLKTDSAPARNITLLHIVGLFSAILCARKCEKECRYVCVCVCVCVCVWRKGGWVGVHTHVHAWKPTTVQQVKDIVTNEYASIIPLEIYEMG